MIERTADLVTGQNDLESLAVYRLPIFQGVTDQPAEYDHIEEIFFDIGLSSGMIQVRNLLDLEQIYSSTHNPGSIGSIWQQHHSEFSIFIENHSPCRVVEIGGGHGILAKTYSKRRPNVEWFIIDPLTNPSIFLDQPKVSVINEYFNENTKLDPSIDTIIHSHFLEHVYNPSAFFNTLSTIQCGTKMIFSVPNLERQLEAKCLTTLSFEHTYFCAEDYIEYWLNKAGFEIVRKKYYLEDHSIFYSTVKRFTLTKTKELPNGFHYEKNRNLFLDYIEYYSNFISRMNKTLKELSEKAFLFGGHISSQNLLLNGLDESNIECVLDNDPKKHGKRLYGTNLMVLNPNILKKKQSPSVIIKSGPYSSEIKTGILDGINLTTRFLE